MEENVKEKEEVVVDNSTANKENVETPGFDPKAFVEASELVDSPTIAGQDNKATEGDVEEKTNTDDFVWDYDTPETKETSTTNDKKEFEQENPTTPTESFNWSETGLEGVNNKNDFDKKVEEYKNLESKLKEFTLTKVKSEKIGKLEEYVSLPDKDLIQKDLEMQGFKDEKLKDALETYEMNGTAHIEAQKIRNTLNKAIKNEKNIEYNKTLENEAKLQKERETSMTELKNHLNDTETMFGFKMAKDSEGLNKVRGEHYEYITSGTFLNSVTENNQNLTEAAWLWKNKDTILKAMTNKGYQNGRKEILDNIQRPDVVGTNRILDPTGKSDDFNPNAFIHGE